MDYGLRLPKQRVYVKNAGISRRLFSFLLDILLLDMTVFSAFAAIVRGVTFDAVLAGNVPHAIYAVAAAMFLLAWTYFALFEWLFGQTVGMMLMKLSVENVSLWKAFVRHCYFVPVFPFPLLWVIEPVHLLWKKVRLLEIMTRTRTIERIVY